MRLGFYPKLAWESIRKNKRLYLPYILTCIGMVMMHYIIAFLSGTPALDSMLGARTISNAMGMASWIVALFAVFFLFYSNSFLTRRRKKEFGLYNILGMGKWNLSKILFWESLIVAGISLVAGLAAGVGLSKLFELGLVNMMTGQVSYDFIVFPDTMAGTAIIFTGIFVLLFLNSLRQISLSNPMELLRSENTGEKPPKANWLFGLAGAVLLIAAYYIALTIEDPVTALAIFFVAVAMVVVATYLLFGSGSVILCRLLQKNKRYYYKANHFVSVSSMTYRMKRNGAGLASICILLTMVLVMLSSTAALYIGTEDVIHVRFPKDINMKLQMQDMKYTADETRDLFRDKVWAILEENNVQMLNLTDYCVGYTEGILTDGSFYNDEEMMDNFNFDTASEAALLYIVPLADYNRIMGKNETLADGEVLIYPFRTEYTDATFQMNGGEVYTVKSVVDDWVYNGNAAMVIIPSFFVFVEDLEAFIAADGADSGSDRNPRVRIDWIYAFDLNVSAGEQIEIYHQIRQTDWMRGLEYADIVYSGDVESQENERAGLYYLFGGLLYLGILLSIVFLLAAVLIIYYKQVSEGYEDQNRFEIMQKVGMTKREIRRSINSQMLTVFYLPLLTAGVHLCFALPVIQKLLLLFNLQNTALLIGTTAVCFLVFGALYALVYKITSNAYFAIVSGAKER